ncbi:MAG: Cob(I)yrinic acid a,c-diamide adenosyltransferase [Candidatus Amesbacteria bacterium GW2011_GWA2_42_12]|uniref:Corrinoid adenosyltransferase n=1 Tax=Candidatus Amesbacteria bacterium GW2011_GWA2_42_12 TaxID=1618356 RepID=A0A0G0Y5E5_9BACT|nr:MAG: Cob(I)yrinic acid a,c-diamide adenosyltransferase [Candidatus Amesbacteria bacterium GW2011_GWA2_42_12]
MNKIYTKTGDKGMTGTFYGRMSKADDLAEALGAIDELNSWIGVVRISPPFVPPLNLSGGNFLKDIQTNLMIINSILAGSTKHKFKSEETKKLERLIDKLTKDLPELKNFIYPIGYLQLARAVCRRAERRAVIYINSKPEILRSKEIKNIVKYLNRLSDALFVMGRWKNQALLRQGFGEAREEVWK